MKLSNKKSSATKQAFIALDTKELTQVKGGIGVLLLDGIESGAVEGVSQT